MADGINKVIVIGNVTKDPEIHYTNSGVPVVNFAVAANESWFDKNQGKKQERAEFVNCVVWSKAAEIIANNVKKGDRLYVEGSMQTRKWEASDGSPRYTTEVKVSDFRFLSPKSSDSDRQAGMDLSDGDDIPF